MIMCILLKKQTKVSWKMLFSMHTIIIFHFGVKKYCQCGYGTLHVTMSCYWSLKHLLYISIFKYRYLLLLLCVSLWADVCSVLLMFSVVSLLQCEFADPHQPPGTKVNCWAIDRLSLLFSLSLSVSLTTHKRLVSHFYFKHSFSLSPCSVLLPMRRLVVYAWYMTCRIGKPKKAAVPSAVAFECMHTGACTEMIQHPHKKQTELSLLI